MNELSSLSFFQFERIVPHTGSIKCQFDKEVTNQGAQIKIVLIIWDI